MGATACAGEAAGPAAQRMHVHLWVHLVHLCSVVGREAAGRSLQPLFLQNDMPALVTGATKRDRRWACVPLRSGRPVQHLQAHDCDSIVQADSTALQGLQQGLCAARHAQLPQQHHK